MCMKKIVNEKSEHSKMMKTATIITLGLTILAIFLSLGALWLLTTMKYLNMEELMYQLSAPSAGTSREMIWDAMIKWVIPGILLMVAVLVVTHICKRKKFAYKLVLSAFALVSCIALTITSVTVWNTLEVKAYLDYQSNPSSFIEENYVDPASVELKFPEKKRNLIYIFLESMEITYADKANGGAFEKNVIPELTQIAESNEDFSGYETILNGGYALPYTTFTMGAMFGQTSGLPLKNNLYNNEMSSQKQFFPAITTLGDILQDNGYQNYYLLGSDATFGGRRLYYMQHGNYDIMDFLFAKQQSWIPDDYYVWWGYEDAKLFSFAKEQLSTIAKASTPFNFTMLTVDTHFEDGYCDEECEDIFGEQYANVMAGSSKKIASFLAWCKMQPWYENTTIVLAGDHPTMDSDFTVNIDSSYQRRTYVAYINAPVQPSTNSYRTYSTLDAFPTTLAALNVEIPGNRLGLGVNLYSTEPTLIERYGLSYVTDEVRKKSTFMEDLAAIDFSAQELKNRWSKANHKDQTDVVYDSKSDS